jgi:hypothetical protein
MMLPFPTVIAYALVSEKSKPDNQAIFYYSLRAFLAVVEDFLKFTELYIGIHFLLKRNTKDDFEIFRRNGHLFLTFSSLFFD